MLSCKISINRTAKPCHHHSRTTVPVHSSQGERDSFRLLTSTHPSLITIVHSFEAAPFVCWEGPLKHNVKQYRKRCGMRMRGKRLRSNQLMHYVVGCAHASLLLFLRHTVQSVSSQEGVKRRKLNYTETGGTNKLKTISKAVEEKRRFRGGTR